MTSSIRPQFFCARPNGTLTPLIALDELPAHVSIRGVPRVLSPSDTQGMTSLGTVSPRAQFYIVDGVPVSQARGVTGSSNQLVRDFELHPSILRAAADDSLPVAQRLALQSFLQQGLSQNWFMGAGGMGNPRQTHNRREAGGHNSKKEYCSYWIRHGECDYQQQGCLYKHEMPTDPAMLEKLGLRDIPRWYRDKYGIPSILNNGSNNLRPQIAPGPHWRDYAQNHALNPALPSSARPIQYPTRLGITAAVDGSSGAGEHQKQKSLTQSSFQQPPGVARGQTHSTRDVSQATETAQTQRHGTKNIPGQGRRIDLLSFDPLPGYPTLDPIRRSLSDVTLSASGDKDAPEEPDVAQHQEFMRSMQSLMTGSGANNGNGHPAASLSSTQAQGRNKKTQKSRRLYQPRTPSELPAKDTVETPSKLRRNNSTNAMSSLFPTSKDSPESASSTAVQGNNVSSTSSSRVPSPSNGSPSSSSDSVTLASNRSRSMAERKKAEAHPSTPSKNESTKNTKEDGTVNSQDVDLFLGLGSDE
ncbi:hypothetical protein VTN02DRAFT_1338 [Thermoascus thermophilus]